MPVCADSLLIRCTCGGVACVVVIFVATNGILADQLLRKN
jgi:hypothetical protein